MTDQDKFFPSALFRDEAYWADPVVIDVLPRLEVYDADVADYLGLVALGPFRFETTEISEGDYLPTVDMTKGESLELVIDGRMTGSKRNVHPSRSRPRLSAEEFDVSAFALLAEGAMASRVRFVQNTRYGTTEFSRTSVVACPGIYAPYLGRPTDLLLRSVTEVPNMVLPLVKVGQTFRPPSVPGTTQDFKFIRAHLRRPLRFEEQHDATPGD